MEMTKTTKRSFFSTSTHYKYLIASRGRRRGRSWEYNIQSTLKIVKQRQRRVPVEKNTGFKYMCLMCKQRTMRVLVKEEEDKEDKEEEKRQEEDRPCGERVKKEEKQRRTAYEWKRKS